MPFPTALLLLFHVSHNACQVRSCFILFQGDVALSLAMGKETTVSPSNLEWPVLSPVFVKFLGACRNENAEAHELLGHSYFTGRYI